MTQRGQREALVRMVKRKLPSGVVTYQLDDFHNGTRVRENLGVQVPARSSPTVQKNLENTAKAVFAKRQEEILRARKGLAIDESVGIVVYAQRFLNGRNDQDHVVRALPYIRTFYADTELRSIDYRSCASFQTFLEEVLVEPRARKATAVRKDRPPVYAVPSPKHLSAKTVHHYFNAFKFILNEAVKDRYLDKSPAVGVRESKVPEKVVIALTEEELERLWQTPIGGKVGAAIRVAFFLSVFTGMRLGDVRSLRWGSISITPDGWKLAKTQDKTGALIQIPMNQSVPALLNPSFSLDPKAFVLPELQSSTSIAKYINPWMKAAGVKKHATFHSARHTFGTLLAQSSGANAMVIQSLMGHATRKMTEHYIQGAGQEARGLVDTLPVLGKAKKL